MSHLSLLIGFALIVAVATPTATAASSGQKFATQITAPSPEIPPAVLQPSSPRPWTHRESGPVDGMQEFAREKSGAVWLGGTNGAARFDARARHPWDRWQYFAGRRWLLDDAVQNIWVDDRAPHRQVWIRTSRGASLIEWRPMTLAEKAELFEQRIEARHVRHGFVADSHLRRAGDLASNQTISNDNDGLWTAMYLGAQAYRFAVTRSPEARARAQRAFRALLRLESITGVPGFYARSFISKDEPQPGDGEWHSTPDGQWRWKGDTSSDESVGHYYGYALYFDLVANEFEKAEIRRVVTRMTDYLIAHDYDLLDLDGRPTRWGQWSERYFKTEEGTYEAPLRCLELLSLLKTTHHITEDPKYDAVYRDRIARGYARRLLDYRRWPGGGEINFSDDELAYLSYAPLLTYEQDSKLRALYVESLRFVWGEVRPDRNPLWNYISVAGGGGRMSRAIREESRRTLERIPVDLIAWNLRNSHRCDIELRPARERFGKLQTAVVLPPDERAVHKWNSNPYVPDGGAGGGGEDDGAFFLLPYWMGRYHGWVK